LENEFVFFSSRAGFNSFSVYSSLNPRIVPRATTATISSSVAFCRQKVNQKLLLEVSKQSLIFSPFAFPFRSLIARQSYLTDAHRRSTFFTKLELSRSFSASPFFLSFFLYLSPSSHTEPFLCCLSFLLCLIRHPKTPIRIPHLLIFLPDSRSK
jgi:hypothetical protein